MSCPRPAVGAVRGGFRLPHDIPGDGGLLLEGIVLRLQADLRPGTAAAIVLSVSRPAVADH